MEKVIVVTGVSGFLGYSVSKRLLDLGFNVLGIDIDESNKIKKYRLDILKFYGDKFIFKNVNIEDPASLIKSLSGYTLISILHFADKSDKKDDLAYVNTNVVGLSNILDIAKIEKTKVIYSSNHAVYTETNSAIYSEFSDTSEPRSVYAATKKSCEVIAHAYSSLYSIPTIGIRFFTVYGPWCNKTSTAYKFIESIIDGNEVSLFKKGTSKRDYTYIDDAVSGVLCALRLDMTAMQKPYEIFNIGSGKSTDNLAFLEIIEKHLGIVSKKNLVKQEEGALNCSCADISKANRLLGYTPKVSLDDGLNNFVEWFKVFKPKIK